MKFKLPYRVYWVSTVIVKGVRSQNIGAQLWATPTCMAMASWRFIPLV